MNGKQIIENTFAIGYNTTEINSQKDALATYIDMILNHIEKVKAAGANKLQALTAADQVIRAHVQKVWGKHEISFDVIRDGQAAILTVGTSTVNNIIDAVQAEIKKAY